ncbi:EAL domain-containing protein [Enterobacter cloacae]|nr:EAL domain-containing protein [Enterobacter cloacae]
MWQSVNRIFDGVTRRRAGRLKQAVSRDEIVAWYQPLVYGQGKKMAGCEILARWHHPVRGVMGAKRFIPLAERTGLIVPVTRALMRQAERDLSAVRMWLPEGFRVNVNLSAAHARSGDFVQDCLRLKRVLEVCRGEVCAEVTEREAFEKVSGGPALVNTLRDAGIDVVLDDFGTGCTGLATLDALRVDGLKLDRRHVLEVPGSGAVSMAEMIIALAHERGLTVHAEGVETQAQHVWLLSRGVMWQQGYYFAPALDAAGFREVLMCGLHCRDLLSG